MKESTIDYKSQLEEVMALRDEYEQRNALHRLLIDRYECLRQLLDRIREEYGAAFEACRELASGKLDQFIETLRPKLFSMSSDEAAPIPHPMPAIEAAVEVVFPPGQRAKLPQEIKSLAEQITELVKFIRGIVEFCIGDRKYVPVKPLAGSTANGSGARASASHTGRRGMHISRF